MNKNKLSEKESKNNKVENLKLEIEDLPELNEEEIKHSTSHRNKQWAMPFIDPSNFGNLEYTGQGSVLQNAGDNVVRCVHVYDTPFAKKVLAMLNATFESIGAHLELGRFTIVVPVSVSKKAVNEAWEDKKSGVEVA